MVSVSESGQQLIDAAEAHSAQDASSVKKQKTFKVKVLKSYVYDPTEKQRQDEERRLKEEEELAERRRVVQVLMEHGVSACNSLIASKRAAKERKLSSQSIAEIKELIRRFESEQESFTKNMREMEQAELERLYREALFKEELANNHGKPKSYFKVPNLSTASRRSSRRFRGLESARVEHAQEIQRKKTRVKAMSQGRSRIFDLEPSHDDYKQSIVERRE